MSSSQSDLLQAKAFRSNVNSLRSRMSSTDNTSKLYIITMPYKYQSTVTCFTVFLCLLKICLRQPADLSVITVKDITIQYNTILALKTRTQVNHWAESEAPAVARGKMVWWN